MGLNHAGPVLEAEIRHRAHEELKDVPLIQGLPALQRLASQIDLHLMPRALEIADEISEELIFQNFPQEKIDFVLENFTVIFESLKAVVGTIDPQPEKENQNE